MTTMRTRVNIDSESKIPLWAAFGAPLIGVPLLVGMLVLGSPATATGGSQEADTGFTVEQVDDVQAEGPVDASAWLARDGNATG